MKIRRLDPSAVVANGRLEYLVSSVSGRSFRAIGSHGKDVQQTEEGPPLVSGRSKNNSKNLWQEPFSDPFQWQVDREEKGNASYPDSRDRKTKPSLWLINKSKPLPWVEGKLAKMASPVDLLTWNRRLAKCVKLGYHKKTMELFQQMRREGICPDKSTFLRVLKACSSLLALEDGRCIHLQIIDSGYDSDLYVGNCLVHMYAKCGSIEDAQKVFYKMPIHNVVTWNAMVLGYVKCGQGKKALELYNQMQSERVDPDSVTFVGLLNACASTKALGEGKSVHQQIIKRGFASVVYVSNSLVDMYAKCGSIEDAWTVFRRMVTPNVVTWNAMILGFAKYGQGMKALELFEQMQQRGTNPNKFTFVAVLTACSSLQALQEGRRVHMQIIQSGYESDMYVGNCLVNMYAKCGSIKNAWMVFKRLPTRDVVAWSSMMRGFLRCAKGEKALKLSRQMEREGVEKDPVIFVGLLNACASVGALEEGRRVHKEIIQCGFECDVYVGSSLVDMYAKCESIEDAWTVFKQMPTRNVVAWSTMILAFAKCGQGTKALELSQQMQWEGVKPNPVTFVGMLNACASVASLRQGRLVHKQIIQSGCESNVYVGGSLIDMYAKCGSIEDAVRVFDRMPIRNVVSWNAMIAGYAMHGQCREALQHFEQMCQEGSEINWVTFISLLSACSHGGLVDEGLHSFELMSAVYSISPTVEHHACLVDLLGRAGRLHEAEDLIKSMLVKSTASVWTSLLSACRVYRNVEMGQHVAQRLLELHPENAAGYLLLSNMYAANGNWDGSANVKRERLDRHVKRTPGLSWIEVNDKVHSFFVNDHKHPEILQIHEELERLSMQMKEAGYEPDSRFVFNDVNKEQREVHLHHHSEKLAIAFGLMSTPSNTQLCIFKNLRMCGDCHTATKFIAKVVGRVIIVRDSNRFHHFQDGFCSCRDYW